MTPKSLTRLEALRQLLANADDPRPARKRTERLARFMARMKAENEARADRERHPA